jgi:nucleoside-diphosphate-sugar epimerase
LKALFIGGTGNISTAVSKLCVERGIDLTLLNRGLNHVRIEGAKTITADVHQFQALPETLRRQEWDVVADWIAFNPADIERDISLFRGKTGQFIFISSASAYQKPAQNPVITESTPLRNPFWDYSRDKIACEEKLNAAYRGEGFPITIVRPSLTYDTVIPVAIGGWREYTIIDRIRAGRKVIVHGDGTSLWTVTHAKDFARGFAGLMGRAQAVGHAFHITSDEILNWNQIYQAVARTAGAEADAVHIASDFICRVEPSLTGTLLGDKSESAVFDNSKIKKYVPGFAAAIPFEEGIRRTLSWFEADASRRVVNPATHAMMDRIIAAYEAKRS